MKKASEVSEKVMEHITEKAIEWSIPMPDNAEDILRDIQEQSDRRNAPLRFVTRYLLSESGFADSLNANAATRIRRYIAVSSMWGAFIVLKNNDKVLEAFEATVGHETGHAVKFKHPVKRFPHIKFTAWLNETYADFYARKNFLEEDTDAAIRAMQFKKEYKIANNNIDKDDVYHPSWDNRIRYMKSYSVFDESLIRQIAKDTGCRSRKAIEKAIRYYL